MTRTRRTSPDESESVGVRTRLLKASYELFTERGYRATTTKEIAARAGVAEPTLFRHFGSKVDVFDAAVLEPLKAYLARWSRSWVDVSGRVGLAEMATQLVEGLYPVIRRDRNLFIELMAARNDPLSDLYPAAVEISGQLRDGLRMVHDAGFAVTDRYGLWGEDMPATIGAVASMVIGAALFDDWAYPAGKRVPGRERMIREMSTLIIDGTTHRSPRSNESKPGNTR